MNNHRFETLDSWRGIAATLVVVHHVFANSHIFALPVIRHGWWAVDFFFVLSGFVITYAYNARLRTGGELRSFALQRIGRVYPLHVFMLAVLIVTELAKVAAVHVGLAFDAPPFSGRNTLFAVLTNLLMVHSFGFHTATAGSWNVPSWSIGVEFYTYFIFAGLIYALKRPQWAFLGLMALSVGVLSTSQWYLGEGFRLGLFRCLLGFLAGHFVWRLWRTPFAQTRIQDFVKRFATPLEVAVFVGAVAAVWYTEFNPWSFALPLVFSAVILVFAFEAGPLSRLLKTAPFALLGTLSYSIYMTHFWIIWCYDIAFDKLAPRFLHVTLTTQVDTLAYFGTNPWMGDAITLAIVATTIGFSLLTYRFVETPGRNYFRHLAKRFGGRAKTPDVAGAATSPSR